MVKVSAADVKKLREATGAGMMDCKKALVEAENNFEEAKVEAPAKKEAPKAKAPKKAKKKAEVAETPAEEKK